MFNFSAILITWDYVQTNRKFCGVRHLWNWTDPLEITFNVYAHDLFLRSYAHDFLTEELKKSPESAETSWNTKFKMEPYGRNCCTSPPSPGGGSSKRACAINGILHAHTSRLLQISAFWAKRTSSRTKLFSALVQLFSLFEWQWPDFFWGQTWGDASPLRLEWHLIR